jgi:hypothetical protein
LTPVRNYSAVLLIQVKQGKTHKASLTGVVDAGEKFLTGANDDVNVWFAGVIDTGEAPK